MEGKRWMTRLTALAFCGFAVACGGGGDDTGDDMAADTGAAAETAPAATSTSPAAPATAANLPAGVTADMVSQGQQIFTGAGNCFTCHGPDGTGTQLAPNLTDNEWIWITGTGEERYNQIVARVKEGVPQPKSHPSPMPPMGGAQLSDDQVNAVAAYVYSLSGS